MTDEELKECVVRRLVNTNNDAAMTDKIVEDRTGCCTVRDTVAFLFEKKSDVTELYYIHEGKKWNVEIRILRVEDEE